MYVVIGTAPTVDTSVAAGPFRSLDRASQASDDLTAKGWNTEICPLYPTREIESVNDWDEN